MDLLRKSILSFVLATTVLVCSGAHAQQFTRSDLNLVIAMDCSWSVNSGEYALQAGGVAAAFSDPEIIKAIQANIRRNISVLVVHWSTAGNQKIAIPWTIISTTSDAIGFAGKVASMERLTANGGTSIAGALRFGQNAFRRAPLPADRYVIDVIADGENNNGDRIEGVRDQVIGRGTTINALAVVNEVSYLHFYLRNRVIGGPGAFVERAQDYVDFKRAFKKKLLREIKGDLITEVDSEMKFAHRSGPNDESLIHDQSSKSSE